MVPDTKLRKYATQKKDAESEHFRRPSSEHLVHHHLTPETLVFEQVDEALK